MLAYNIALKPKLKKKTSAKVNQVELKLFCHVSNCEELKLQECGALKTSTAEVLGLGCLPVDA